MRTIIKEGTFYSKSGFPVEKVWFSDRRLAVSYDKLGIKSLEYFLSTSNDCNRIMFSRNIFDCFRPAVLVENRCFSPEYENVYLYPYGFDADWKVRGCIYQISVYAVDSNIVFRLKGEHKCKFRLTFFESTQFIPAFNGSLDSRDYGLKRVWRDWFFNRNVLIGGMSERKEEKDADDSGWGLSVGISSDKIISYNRSECNYRNEMVICHENESCFCIVFGEEKEDICQSTVSFTENVRSRLEKQKIRYEQCAAKLPDIQTPYSEINTFCRVAPLFHESLKTDREGAIRAKNARYWVWGWDSMVSNDVTVSCWQEGDSIRAMLDYFENTSDKAKGWGHWFYYDNTIKEYAVPAAQGIYISLLNDYIALSGDETALEKHYSFAVSIFKKMLTNKSGCFFVGKSLFPDFPQYLHETGNDISLFNNSVAYAAVRAMEKLANKKNDAKTLELARNTAEGMEKFFREIFYDKQKGYLVSSVDSQTLQKRNCYNICSYFWDSDFHDLLFGMNIRECKDFVLRNVGGGLAFISYPLWGDVYDKDANQLHATWGVVEEVILRIAKYTGCKKLIEQWIKKVAYWVNMLTCPEGESYEFETDDPGYDRWNCDPGTWQAYTIRKWYKEIIQVLLGISFDEGGISFSDPHCTFKMSGLQYHGMWFDIATEGKGQYLQMISVNEKKLCGCCKIPRDMLFTNKTNRIKLILGNTKQEGIVKAHGMKISEYVYDGKVGTISFVAEGNATCSLFVDGEYLVNIGGTELVPNNSGVADNCYKIFMSVDRPVLFTLKRKRYTEIK